MKQTLLYFLAGFLSSLLTLWLLEHMGRIHFS